MTALTPILDPVRDLPGLIDRAASMLAGAKTAAEVLEAREVELSVARCPAAAGQTASATGGIAERPDRRDGVAVGRADEAGLRWEQFADWLTATH